MFKKGFTLAEILVALSIVGIVASISAPVISKIVPDKEKIGMLKAYKSLNDATQELINDPGYYINGSDTTGECIGLACTTQSMSDADAKDEKKYAYLLSRYFGVDVSSKGSGWTFTTNDQVEWQVLKDDSDHYVSIDLNGEGLGQDCFYGTTKSDNTKCKKPDRFQFKVAENGIINGNDALTIAYLETRLNIKNRSKDLEKADLKEPQSLNVKAWVEPSS